MGMLSISAGTKKTRNLKHATLLRYARALGFGDIQYKIDVKRNLMAIVGIHSTQLGPAIGGCRLRDYESFNMALQDVIRLSYMMTLKAAICKLPHGGGKAVIMKPSNIENTREDLFEAFGDFVQEINGRYVTAIDVGTSTADMNIIAKRSPYVVGATDINARHSDPAQHTVRGVVRGIEAAVKFKLKRNDLQGVRVAIQGLGHVGSQLAKELHQLGAKLIVTDREDNRKKIDEAIEEYDAKYVDITKIYDVDCDVFAPCALGGTINHDTIERIKAPIIAGSANNQLSHHLIGRFLLKKNILYAPDFVINAGGLINAAAVYDNLDLDTANKKIDHLYDVLIEVFERAEKNNTATEIVAEKMAKELLSSAKHK